MILSPLESRLLFNYVGLLWTNAAMIDQQVNYEFTQLFW